MKRFVSILFVLLLTIGFSYGQTSVYLRDNPYAFTISSCTNAIPMVCTVSSTSGLSTSPPNNIVEIGGVCSNNPGAFYISPANGIRKITAIGGGTITLADLSGTPIAGNGAWCSGAGDGYAASVQYGGRLSSYNLVSGVRGYFDGDNGSLTREWALGPANGLTSLICNGSSCTVTTSYNHTARVGDHISIYNSGVAGLDRDGRTSDYVISAATSTAYTFPSTVSSGNYTNSNLHCGPAPSPNGLIGGTESCIRISQRAVTINPFWDRMAGVVSYYGTFPQYKFITDGAGGTNIGAANTNFWPAIATTFLLDQANGGLAAGLHYLINNVEKVGGAGFISSEVGTDSGNFDISANPIGGWVSDVGQMYTVWRRYESPASRQTFIDKMVNDVDDSTPCTKTLFVGHDLLASGVAGSTQNDATHITLSASDSAANGFYVNTVIELQSVNGSGSKIYSTGAVTAYDNTTKIATVVGWEANGATSFNPTPGMTYSIFSAATISNIGNQTAATVTGYHTTFTSHVSPGDWVYVFNEADNAYVFDSGKNGSIVTSVNSDTSLTVYNSTNLVQIPGSGSLSVPRMYIYSPKWTTGKCGAKWIGRYSEFMWGSQPIQYPVRGSYYTDPMSNLELGYGSTWSQFMMAIADDDARAIPGLAFYQTPMFDQILGGLWNLTTGITDSGSNYGTGIVGPFMGRAAWWLQHNVVGFPDMNTAGPWTEGISTYKMFSLKPDKPWSTNNADHIAVPFLFGDVPTNNYGTSTSTDSPIILDHGSAWNPTAPSSQYFKDWLVHGINYTPSSINVYIDELAVKMDQRIVASDYTAQPKQYFFGTTSYPVCAAITGFPCNPIYMASNIYSRTSWTDPAATDLLFESRTYLLDHDAPNPGNLQVYKAGFLLGNDAQPVGSAPRGGIELTGFAPEFQGLSITRNWGLDRFGDGTGPAITTPLRWASANHGSWPVGYGDQASNYMYVASELKNNYTTAYNRAQKSIVHFKKLSTEEIIIQYDDINTSNAPTQVAVHTHYPQNLQAASPDSSGGVPYTEGDTTCPGSGGCGSLNANRTVLEQETGTASAHGDPTPQYNMVSKFVVPSGAPGVFLKWDGSAYPSSSGNTYRVSACADASSTGACGATGQNSLELITVHKIATQPDTSLTVTALNPDANWTGVQTADKVALFGRGGTTHSTMTGFTTTHAGTAQYLFGGLTPGTYSVTVNGSPVTGSPFTVVANDNSIEFENTAGMVSINGSGGSPALALGPSSLSYSCVSGGSNPAVQTINVSAVNVTLDNWSAAKTKSWLTLSPVSGSAAGSIAASVNCAGQPAGTQTDTIIVSSTTTGITNSPQTAAVSLTVTASSSSVSSTISGKTSASGNVTVH
jgi:hypothetical protein